MTGKLRRAAGFAFVFGFAIAAVAVAATPTGTISQATELRAKPFTDGQLLKQLPAGTEVSVLQREGGWYEIKAPEQGWVPMWRVRFPAGSGGGGAIAAIQSGRAAATRSTATTGVRGLSEEELARATPDPAAVVALEQLAVPPDQARVFALQGKLQADRKRLKKD